MQPASRSPINSGDVSKERRVIIRPSHHEVRTEPFSNSRAYPPRSRDWMSSHSRAVPRTDSGKASPKVWKL